MRFPFSPAVLSQMVNEHLRLLSVLQGLNFPRYGGQRSYSANLSKHYALNGWRECARLWRQIATGQLRCENGLVAA